MSHWIVKIKKHGYAGYSHMESNVDPLLLATNPGPDGKVQSHIISTDAGPFDTPEEAWQAWHKKHGHL